MRLLKKLKEEAPMGCEVAARNLQDEVDNTRRRETKVGDNESDLGPDVLRSCSPLFVCLQFWLWAEDFGARQENNKPREAFRRLAQEVRRLLLVEDRGGEFDYRAPEHLLLPWHGMQAKGYEKRWREDEVDSLWVD